MDDYFVKLESHLSRLEQLIKSKDEKYSIVDYDNVLIDDEIKTIKITLDKFKAFVYTQKQKTKNRTKRRTNEQKMANNNYTKRKRISYKRYILNWKNSMFKK